MGRLVAAVQVHVDPVVSVTVGLVPAPFVKSWLEGLITYVQPWPASP